ncbi:hypothetical protein KHS38_12200 [Mucilaginibacter sp. Bleaf8]|uniref:hypothetical protein n=1 Tax=Mucilaginibacter sp. Bleaf8 TaxID=2834430 RepID=UPI001BD15618|nr:hypothetical protein [Mucilaginibacter sp. Bleaf8]MBS7565167.1 hypothetical protein [Mucilaginibacter sp. Bleaf8]
MAEETTLNLSNEELAQKWAEIVVDRWMQALQKQRIGATGELQRSFLKELHKAGGDVDKVIFRFYKYGRFPDMGVGRGMSLNGRVLNRRFDRYTDMNGRTAGRQARRKKPWYTKTFYREVAKFRDLYQRQYGQQIAGLLESGLTDSITLTT